MLLGAGCGDDGAAADVALEVVGLGTSGWVFDIGEEPLTCAEEPLAWVWL